MHCKKEKICCAENSIYDVITLIPYKESVNKACDWTVSPVNVSIDVRLRRVHCGVSRVYTDRRLKRHQRNSNESHTFGCTVYTQRTFKFKGDKNFYCYNFKLDCALD